MSNNNNMRNYGVSERHILSFLLLVLLIVVVASAMVLIPILKMQLTVNIPDLAVEDSVLRFHCRANSDSKEDQEVKMKVKEAVLSELQQDMEGLEATKENTIEIIHNNMQGIVDKAENTLKAEGFSYGVKAYFTREEFPVKKYGDMTFPAGVYDAFRIDLGEAKGHNWWCMLYPSLCFYEPSMGVVPEESKEELKSLLSEEDYEQLLYDENEDVEFHSKLIDTIKEWWDNVKA